MAFSGQVEVVSLPRPIHEGGIAGSRVLDLFQTHEIPRTFAQAKLTGIFPDQKIWDLSEQPGFGLHGKRIK